MASKKEDLLDVLKTAELIGISLKGVQIGTKKKAKMNQACEPNVNMNESKMTVMQNKSVVMRKGESKRTSAKANGDNFYVKKERTEPIIDDQVDNFAANDIDSDHSNNLDDLSDSSFRNEGEERESQHRGVEVDEQSVDDNQD